MSRTSGMSGSTALSPSPATSTRDAPVSRLAPRFRPQCTHLTMTRLYGFEFTCDNCRRPGGFGWVYRCTQDQEDAIEHAIDNGCNPTFDEVGREMTVQLKERKRGPKARYHELSFFDEVSPAQLNSYTPEKLKAILIQREDVQRIAKQDIESAILRHGFENNCGEMVCDPLTNSTVEDSPWLTNHTKPCEYTICPRCRPGAADRTWLSLDGVLGGDIAPTAAVGYGFHVMGYRPVVDADILRTIGDREDPASRHSACLHDYSATSSSATSILAMLDNQIAQANAMMDRQGEARAEVTSAVTKSPQTTPSTLKHSPRVENLAAFAETDVVHNQGYSVRPPWTPPPSPSPYGKGVSISTHAVGLAAEKSISNGRSSNSLKINQGVRSQVMSSVPTSNALDKLAQSGSSEHIPYLDETEYDIALTLPFDEQSFAAACGTPMIPPDADEETYFLDHRSPMMQYEKEEGLFRPEPLEVEDGVAVLEESVELGVPDVVMQV